MKIVDLKLHIDGLHIKDDETVESFIEKIAAIAETTYDIQWEILYEERI